MGFTIKFFEERGPANDDLAFDVVVTGHLTGQITISKPDLKLVRVLEASSHNLNHGVTLAGSATREDIIDANGCVEETAIIAREDVREDTALSAGSLLRRRLHDHLGCLHHALASVAEVSLAPRVRLANDIEGKRAELAASDLIELGKGLAFNVIADLLGVPACLSISKTRLAVDAEAPLVEVTTVGESCSVAETCRARFDANFFALLIGRELNFRG